MQCPYCRQTFCPSHRLPEQHQCHTERQPQSRPQPATLPSSKQVTQAFKGLWGGAKGPTERTRHPDGANSVARRSAGEAADVAGSHHAKSDSAEYSAPKSGASPSPSHPSELTADGSAGNSAAGHTSAWSFASWRKKLAGVTTSAGSVVKGNETYVPWNTGTLFLAVPFFLHHTPV